MLVRLLAGAAALTAVLYGLSLTLDRAPPGAPEESGCCDAPGEPAGPGPAPAPAPPRRPPAQPQGLLDVAPGLVSAVVDDDEEDDDDDDEDKEDGPREKKRKGKGRG